MKQQMFEINSMKELEEIIKKNKGILLVDFTSPTCPPCLMLEPVLEELVESQLCSIAKINVLENQDIAESLNISATPTIVIFKDKEVVKSILGYQPIEVWEEMIKKL